MSDSEELRASFWDELGLDLPAVPQSLEGQVTRFDWNHIGTTDELDPSLDYRAEPALSYLQGVVPDQWVLSYWGHGINSYSSNFRYAFGVTAVFVQTGFGAMGERDTQRERWNEVVDHMNALIALHNGQPEGVPRTRSYLVYYSDFRMGHGSSGNAPSLLALSRDARWEVERSFSSWSEFREALPLS